MRSPCLLLACLLCISGAYAACPAPPPAQRDVIADFYYDDPPVYSHIDPVKHAAYEAAVQPLEHFMGEVAAMASKGEADCALRWLVAWAEGDAMLGKIEKEQAHYERKWILAGLALSYAKVRPAASRDQKAAIDTWLQALADGVRQHSQAYQGERNNHYYWEGLAVAATGAVTGNPGDVAWGRKVFDDAMAQIADDGSFPRELTRGGRALHYHLFAVAPLVMLESVLDAKSPRLGRLVKFCVEGLKHPEKIAKRAGVAQIGILDDDADWLTVYLRRHHAKGFAALPAKRKPYVNRLGGALDKANPLEHPRKH
jgi:poly(beta-D-mannuronate) lyase